MQAVYPPVAQGFIPNSVLTKLLWPQSAKEKHAEQKREEWKLPEFSTEQLEQITKLKQVCSENVLKMGVEFADYCHFCCWKSKALKQ